MKKVTWHIPREAIARVYVEGEVMVNSAYSSVFEKRSGNDELVIPTELAVAVDLAEIKERLISWYKKEMRREPGAIITVYRYPAGGLKERAPIGVGLAACRDVREGDITVGHVEVLVDAPPSSDDPELHPQSLERNVLSGGKEGG